MSEKKLWTAEDAEKAGYTVDRHCYPWFGYKGERFAPTDKIEVVTDRELEWMTKCRGMVFDLANLQAKVDIVKVFFEKNTGFITIEERAKMLKLLSFKISPGEKP